jgi:hypothetical protein
MHASTEMQGNANWEWRHAANARFTFCNAGCESSFWYPNPDRQRGDEHLFLGGSLFFSRYLQDSRPSLMYSRRRTDYARMRDCNSLTVYPRQSPAPPFPNRKLVSLPLAGYVYFLSSHTPVSACLLDVSLSETARPYLFVKAFSQFQPSSLCIMSTIAHCINAWLAFLIFCCPSPLVTGGFCACS